MINAFEQNRLLTVMTSAGGNLFNSRDDRLDRTRFIVILTNSHDSTLLLYNQQKCFVCVAIR